jgi:hypothetical protein
MLFVQAGRDVTLLLFQRDKKELLKKATAFDFLGFLLF